MAEKTQKSEAEAWDVLMYPHLAEKSMKMVEAENKLVFIVRRNSRRAQIKQAIETAFSVKVQSVNFEITTDGEKRAFIKLKPGFSASDIASRMGMV
jgi:large subunit ribosomal protein L23